ncbi:MAG: ABC transporter permease [Candidatus Geothermarchaeales archaeon]
MNHNRGFLTELSLNLRAAYARTWVRIVGGNREPMWIAFEVMMPLLTLSAYVFVYRVLNAPPEFTGFVVLGGMMLSFWLNVLWNMAAQLYWEKETGNLTHFLIAPISRMAILLGMALGGAINTTLRAIAILVFGTYIFQVEYTIGDPLTAMAVFILTLIAIYAVGMLFSSLFLMYGREAWHSANLFQEPVYFVSGFYFPVTLLPFWIQVAASILPITFGLDGIRNVLINGAHLDGVYVHILVLLLFIVILLPLARWGLAYMERLAKKEGRLTLRWR